LFGCKDGLVMSTIPKRMHKLSISKLIIGTKVKRFVLVPKQNFRKQISRSFLFSPKNSGTKQNNSIWSGNFLRQTAEMFPFNPVTYRSMQTFCFGSKIFLWKADCFHVVSGKAERFYLIQKIDRSKTF
jgi:hypothetical protein